MNRIIFVLLIALCPIASYSQEAMLLELKNYFDNCERLSLVDPESSLESINKYESIVNNLDKPRTKWMHLLCKSKHYIHNRDFDNALSNINDMIDLSDSINQISHRVESRSLLSDLYMAFGQADLSLKAILEADSLLKITKSPIDTMMLAGIANKLGGLFLNLKKYDLAEEQLKKYLHAKLIDKPEKIVKSMLLWNLTSVYFMTEKVDSFVKYRNTYTSFLESEFNLKPDAFHFQTMFENDFGMFDEERVIRMLPELKRKSNEHWIASMYNQLSKHYLLNKEYGKSNTASDSSLNYSPSKSMRTELLRNRMSAFENLGNYKKALTSLQEFNRLDKEINDPTSQANINQLQVKYEIEKKEREILSQGIELERANSVRNMLLVGLFSISLLLFGLWQRYKRKLTEGENEKYKQNETINSLELKSLRSQMNPHFLFNTLNSINWYIIKNKTKDASKYLTKFSKLMRQILDNSREELIPLNKELSSLNLYVDLESIRFEGEFDFDIELDPMIQPEQLLVPPLIFQPFVENAIWHGLVHKKEHGNIQLEIKNKNDHIICNLTDNGIGRKAPKNMQIDRGEKHRSSEMEITEERIKKSII